MPPSSSNKQFRTGAEKAAGLRGLNVSLAESEYREQRASHRRQQSLQSLRGGVGPLPSPLSPTFSRDDRPPPHRPAAAAATGTPTSGPPPPYLASMPSSPAYSQGSFAPLDPAQKQELLDGRGGNVTSPRQSSLTYLSPYGSGGAGGYMSSNSTEWIPMRRPLPPIGTVAAAQSRRRRRLRMAAFCLAPMVLFIVVGILVIVLGFMRPGTIPA